MTRGSERPAFGPGHTDRRCPKAHLMQGVDRPRTRTPSGHPRSLTVNASTVEPMGFAWSPANRRVLETTTHSSVTLSQVRRTAPTLFSLLGWSTASTVRRASAQPHRIRLGGARVPGSPSPLRRAGASWRPRIVRGTRRPRGEQPYQVALLARRARVPRTRIGPNTELG
jgi:hypothetical protein